MHQDAKRLLEQLGAWEEYGASGWKMKDGSDGSLFDPKQKAYHGTKAQDKDSKSQYFTPKAMDYIRQYYAKDYQHPKLNFAPPGESS